MLRGHEQIHYVIVTTPSISSLREADRTLSNFGFRYLDSVEEGADSDHIANGQEKGCPVQCKWPKKDERLLPEAWHWAIEVKDVCYKSKENQTYLVYGVSLDRPWLWDSRALPNGGRMAVKLCIL